jgi:16S rRNA (guanine966-N2)-methyltransferase
MMRILDMRKAEPTRKADPTRKAEAVTRIIAGEAGGRRLRTPPGSLTRPTSDRVREALFSALEAQLGTIAGRRFLDLYAGSGAIGLEASSRGAAQVTLVERDAKTAGLIRANARDLGLVDVTVIAGAAQTVAAQPPAGEPFDVAFLDPPYAAPAGDVAAVVGSLVAARWLGSEAVVVVERSRRDGEWIWPEGFDMLRAKRYGETMLWYGRVASSRP